MPLNINLHNSQVTGKRSRLLKLLPAGLILAFACLLCTSNAKAQYFNSVNPYNTSNFSYDGSSSSGIGILLSAGIDVPVNNLNNIYQSATAFDAGITKSWHNFVFGLNFGYRQFPPKFDSYKISYNDGYNTYSGTASYGYYSIFSVYGSVKYEAPIGQNVNFYGGINAGIYSTNYSYNTQIAGDYESTTVKDGFAYFAPKVGVDFTLGEQVQMGIETRYNIYGSGNYSSPTAAGTQKSSIAYTTWTTAVTLSYWFP